jgi:hypothetical protein
VNSRPNSTEGPGGALAVFNRWFDTEAAGAMLFGDGIQVADVLDIVTRLRDKSPLDSRVIGATVYSPY